MRFEYHFWKEMYLIDCLACGALKEPFNPGLIQIADEELQSFMERSSILTIPSDEYGFDVLAWVLADEEVPNTLRELADIVAESPRFQIEAGVLAIIYRSMNNWQSMVDWSGIPSGAYQIEILSLQKWRDQNYHRCVISPLSRFDSWCYQSLEKWAEIAGVILYVLIVFAVFGKLLMYTASVHRWLQLSFLLLLIPGW